VAAYGTRRRAQNITPPIASNAYGTKIGPVRKTAIDGRTTRHTRYARSQGKRQMIEGLLGGGQPHGTLRQTNHRGRAGGAADFLLTLIGSNLVRIPHLLADRGEMRLTAQHRSDPAPSIAWLSNTNVSHAQNMRTSFKRSVFQLTARTYLKIV
jgi:hypothetical protein